MIIQKYQQHGWKTWSSLSHANFEQSASITAARAQESLLKCPKACGQTQFKKIYRNIQTKAEKRE